MATPGATGQDGQFRPLLPTVSLASVPSLSGVVEAPTLATPVVLTVVFYHSATGSASA